MTIAYDKITNRPVGQVTVCGGTQLLVLLTKNGYVNVDAASVRIEETND